jgi:AcrR family transcriptional regulator
VARHDRKSQILDAALTLFSERGYHGTGMEDIARSIGMGASSLYNHMSSKQDLLAGIMLTTMDDLLAAFDSATAEGTASQRLHRAMDAHVRYHAVHRREARIGNREIPSLHQPAQDVVRDRRRAYARRWEALIDDGVAAGEFTAPSSRLTAYALLEMGIGVAQWFRDDGPLSVDAVAEEYADMALRQVGATAPATKTRPGLDGKGSLGQNTNNHSHEY